MTADRAGAARAAAEAVGAGVTTGLSAFPLTPLRDDRVDEHAYAGIVERLARAGIDSIGALGSTGSYAYLDRAERRRVAELTVRHAGGTPVIVGISALRTSHARALAHDAQAAGASAVIQPGGSIRDDEVIAAADEKGIAMTFTGVRVFRH